MNYYYYISGLPDIRIEDTNIHLDMTSLKNELKEEVSEKDFRLIRLFYLKYDNTNLIKLLNENEAELKQEGIYSKEDLLTCIREIKEIGETRIDCPEYFSLFLQSYFEGISIVENLSWEDQLYTLFYEYAQKAENKFVRDWFAFEMNLNNIQIGSYCRKYQMDQRKNVIGNNEIAETIRTSNSKDFGLSGMIDELEDILRITDEQNIFEREKMIDLIKWKYLENNSFFNYFSIERIVVFLLQTEIITRWIPLTKEHGDSMFRDIVKHLISGKLFKNTNLSKNQ